MIECGLCHRFYRSITNTHLGSKHSITTDEYLVLFPATILSNKKGKTYEELYGDKRAGQMRDVCSESHIGIVQSEETKQKRRNSLLGKNKGKIYVPRETKICPTCGNTFEVIITSKKKFCSCKCIDKGPSPRKGRTYEEIFGIEKAMKLKQDRSNARIGKTFAEIVKNVKIEDVIKKMSESAKNRENNDPKKGKTFDEYYGEARSKEIKDKLRQKTIASYINGVHKRHPNNFELKVFDFLRGSFPRRFRLTADNSFVVGERFPDFVDEENNIVVLANGIYWHLMKNGLEVNEENKRLCEEEEIIPYLKAGFDVWFIWEDSIEKVVQYGC